MSDRTSQEQRTADLSVLMWMPRASEIPGGHRVQLDKTAAALAELGLRVTTCLVAEPPASRFDVVHGFGLTAAEVHLHRRRGSVVALSTIYCDRSYRFAYAGGRPKLHDLPRRAVRAGRVARRALGPRSEYLTTMLREAQSETDLIAAYSAADVLLPNAEGERRAIVHDLGVATQAVVVPNAVDPEVFQARLSPSEDRDAVLCVGRIEPHKNQLGLIEALRDSPYRLIIAGPAHPHHPEYHRQCVAAGGSSVEFLGNVPHDDLGSVYERTRVHVLPTWFETTGLVSLEAALNGCAVVTTSRGHAREYFGDLAHYCDPADPASIRRAVDAAWRDGPQALLRERILENYTWRHTAEATLSAYRRCLR